MNDEEMLAYLRSFKVPHNAVRTHPIADRIEALLAENAALRANAARKVVKVPLTKLVGRTIEGETEPVVHFVPTTAPDLWEWRSDLSKFDYFHLPVDLDTGLVRVYAEGDA